MKLFEDRHIETVEQMKEVSTLATSIQVQVKEREEIISYFSSNDINLVTLCLSVFSAYY
jgi:hypothetical protein